MRVRPWLRGFVAAAVLAAAAGLAPAADHATTYLDPLESAIAARVAEIGTPATPALRKELNLLRAAGRALDHDTSKLSADLSVLAKALVHLRKIGSTVPSIPMSVESAVSALRSEVGDIGGSMDAEIEQFVDAGVMSRQLERLLRNKMRVAENAWERSASAPNHQKAASLLAKSAKLLEQVRARLDTLPV